MPLRAFHPAVRDWFIERVCAPSAPQVQGWPEIGAGRDVLIAAPTGTGKTLAAFLFALDNLLRQGDRLANATQVLHVSSLKALSNDIVKNLQAPLAELAQRDPALPEVRVLVRTGDTPQKARAAMSRRPPHILVTTPESPYILLTSAGGRLVLKTVRSVTVDEIHALAPNKRCAHLALSLERLAALTGAPVQRIGLSARQKPELDGIGRFLAGTDRPIRQVDAGHLRHLDLGSLAPAGRERPPCRTITSEHLGPGSALSRIDARRRRRPGAG